MFPCGHPYTPSGRCLNSCRELTAPAGSNYLVKTDEVSLPGVHPCFFILKKAMNPNQHRLIYPLVNFHKKRWKDPPFYSWELTHYFDWAIFYVANCYIVITRPGSSSPRRFRPHQFGTWSGPPGTRSPLLLHTTCGCVQKF